jgi:hypothetical protein
MNEFIKVGENIHVNVPYMEAYISMDLFDDADKESAVATQYGEGIKTIGLFNIRAFSSEEDVRERVEIKTFSYPNTIETHPSEYESNVKLFINGIEDKYMVLKYYKGDIMMHSAIKQDSTNCERFLNMLTKGKIPNTINYTDIFKIWLKNFEINAVNPGVPAVTLQVIISEMYRNKNNPIEQFRKIAGKGKVGMYDYLAFNMNEVSSYTSVLSALTFERFSDKLTSSINMTKDGVSQTKSPVEKVISM